MRSGRFKKLEQCGRMVCQALWSPLRVDLGQWCDFLNLGSAWSHGGLGLSGVRVSRKEGERGERVDVRV